MEDRASAATRAEPAAPERAHEPEPGSAYTTTGLKADLRRKYDYPADARCRNCGRWIRCGEFGKPWGLKYAERV